MKHEHEIPFQVNNNSQIQIVQPEFKIKSRNRGVL